MKISKTAIQSKTHSQPTICFQDQKLTSYAGATLLQLLFKQLDLKTKLSRCFRPLRASQAYTHATITLLLIVHSLLGYRRLQDTRYYENDPMILHLLGLHVLPDCSTISRRLAQMNTASVDQLRSLTRTLVIDGLVEQSLRRITLDFDGSVVSTGRYAEGTAVGFNRKNKGQRSYYPLLCTIAQTGQVLDVWHRPGNVHDSNGAKTFIISCIKAVNAAIPKAVIEVRMDSAFFSEAIVDTLANAGIEFSISVPFARYAALKNIIEQRQRWRHLNEHSAYFESRWKPNCWAQRYRFVMLRQYSKVQHKAPVQLDLFTPYHFQQTFKVIITNKTLSAKKLLNYHNGRGYQENLFAELKTQVQMDYVPTRKLAANQVYLLATLIAHNLNRAMQMRVNKPVRHTTEKRTPLWLFEKMDSIRRKLLQQAGRLTNPKGVFTLTMNANTSVENDFLHYMSALAS